MDNKKILLFVATIVAMVAFLCGFIFYLKSMSPSPALIASAVVFTIFYVRAFVVVVHNDIDMMTNDPEINSVEEINPESNVTQVVNFIKKLQEQNAEQTLVITQQKLLITKVSSDLSATVKAIGKLCNMVETVYNRLGKIPVHTYPHEYIAAVREAMLTETEETLGVRIKKIP